MMNGGSRFFTRSCKRPEMKSCRTLPNCFTAPSRSGGGKKKTLLFYTKYLTEQRRLHYALVQMNEFKQSVGNALHYWEARRVVYNAALLTVLAGWVILTWPHFRSVRLMGIPPGETHPTLLILTILAFLANVCYCAAYLV